MFAIERQKRNDDAKPDEIGEDDQKHYQHGGLHTALARGATEERLQRRLRPERTAVLHCRKSNGFVLGL